MNSAIKAFLISAVVVFGLTMLRLKPWDRPAGDTQPGPGGGTSARTADQRERLRVGFLPVT